MDKTSFFCRLWISLVLLVVGLSACTNEQTRNNSTTSAPSTPTSLLDPSTCLAKLPISFAGPQGEQLQGSLLGEGETGVVLSNDSGNRACGWGYLIPLLLAAKFRVLVYQYGAQNPVDELLAAASFLAAQPGNQHMILMGASQGAEATVVASSRDLPGLVAAISLSADEYLPGVDAEASATKITVPILFFTAQVDPFGSYKTSQSLFSLAASKEKRLVVIPGSLHGVQLLSDKSIQSQIMDFIQAHR